MGRFLIIFYIIILGFVFAASWYPNIYEAVEVEGDQ